MFAEWFKTTRPCGDVDAEHKDTPPYVRDDLVRFEEQEELLLLLIVVSVRSEDRFFRVLLKVIVCESKTPEKEDNEPALLTNRKDAG